jgi:hypothetical protein
MRIAMFVLKPPVIVVAGYRIVAEIRLFGPLLFEIGVRTAIFGQQGGSPDDLKNIQCPAISVLSDKERSGNEGSKEGVRQIERREQQRIIKRKHAFCTRKSRE